MIKTLIRRAVRIMTLIIFAFMAIIFILLGILWLMSPGKPEPFLDRNGNVLADSISEKVFMNIGGVRQGMIIRGMNMNNPVLLFVHGGPGFPEYFLLDRFDTGLEKYFTICYWEQRGSGLSYSSDVSFDSMNMDQFKSDTLEVANYLRTRFKQDKIYMMAHSGGTLFAIQAAAAAPELFEAYIAVGQLSRQAESEKLAYRYMMDRYSEEDNIKNINKLKEYPILESDEYLLPYFKAPIRDAFMHELGIGTMRNMKSVLTGIFIPVMTCRAYTLSEKINFWRSKFFFIRKTKIIEQVITTDITQKVQKLEIPVYFFSGYYDFTVNHDMAKAYLEQLDAPLKGFYSFKESAHSPMIEEPQKTLKIMTEDVLTGRNTMADVK